MVRNYLIDNFNNINFDALYENFVYNELSRLHKVKYWRTTAKTEVDFVIENKRIIPLEVKSIPKMTRALRSFIETYKPETAFVATIKETGKKKLGSCDVFTVPLVYF